MLIEAIVIKTMPTREQDKLVTLYSRESGKIITVAKGALRPHSIQALQLDPGNLIHCELVPSRTGVSIITGAQAVDCFSRMKSVPRLWATAQFFLQATDLIIFEQEPDPKLWSCLSRMLKSLDGAEADDTLRILRQYQISLLEALGYGGIGAESVHCQPIRTGVDDFFEYLANHRLRTLDLVYELA